jgi:hypothetical protein
MRHSLFFAALVLAAAPSGALGANEKPAPARPPSRAEARAVCDMIAARGSAIRAMLVKDGVLDANNDGVADAVTVGMSEGTMRGDVLQFRPRGAAKDSPAVDVNPEGFQPGDYLPFGARWLAYGGRVYALYFDTETLRHASYLGYTDARNTERLVCDFSVAERETLRPAGGRDADGLCRAVAQKTASYAPLIESEDADPEMDAGRRETHVAGRITIDFANAGAPVPLALLAYESGAGRGCDFSYFDIVTGSGIASSGDAHATLMRLQGVEPEQQHTSGSCDGAVPRWLGFGGLVYLDIASRRESVDPFHEVKLVRKGRIETRCKGEFAVRWQVKSMGPDFQ